MKSNTKQISDTTQQQWLRRAKAGDQQAFSQLVESYQQAVINLSYQLLHNVDDAHDAAQETFLRAYCKLDTYQDGRSFATWLFAIARNYCLDQLKKNRPQSVSWDELPEQYHPSQSMMGQPEATLIANETKITLRTVVRSLPKDYRQVVSRRYWQTESCQEIAQALDTTVNTVKGRLFRARKEIRSQYIGDSQLILSISSE